MKNMDTYIKRQVCVCLFIAINQCICSPRAVDISDARIAV